MKRIKYLLLTAVIAATIAGCTEDKGNYDYDEVVAASIDPIPTGIVLEQFQNYKLELGMKFSKPGYSYEDFEYVWYAYKFVPSTGTTGTLASVDTLSHERVLDAMVALPADEYKLTFRVTDKKTGVYSSVSEQIKVKNGASQGHVILCDADGFAEVNFVNSLGEVKRGVFEGVNGKKAGRNPLGLDYSQNMMYSSKILYIRCEDETGGSLVSHIDFSEFTTIANLFSIKPAKMKPQAINTVGIKYFEAIVNDGILYSRNLRYDIYSPYWEPVWGDFYLSRFIFSNNVGATVIYDEKNKKFVKFNTIQPDMRPQAAPIDPGEAPVFDPNNMGMEMLQGYIPGSSPLMRMGRAVMKDDAGKYYLLSFDLNSNGGVFTPQRILEITGHEGIAGATTFTFTTDGAFMYYNIGNKISYSSFTTGLHIKTFSDLIPAGHIIDHLYIDISFKFSELCVTTNDGSGGPDSGSLFIFGIGSDGNLTKKAEYLNCCGKVVDIIYKQ